MHRKVFYRSSDPYLFILVFALFFSVTGCDDPVENDIWDDFNTPEIEYINRDSGGSGQIYDMYIPDPVNHLQGIARTVSQLLYHEPAEVPYITKITLIIDYFDGIAWKSGSPPEITISLSSKYLQEYMDSGRDVLYEINGILHHELTHGYQYDDDRYSALSGLIEGVADTVRYFAGYIPSSDRHKGGHWTSGYKTTAFFFVWIQEEKHSDFLYELNKSLDPDDGIHWTWDEIERITGESVSSLWSQYQASL